MSQKCPIHDQIANCEVHGYKRKCPLHGYDNVYLTNSEDKIMNLKQEHKQCCSEYKCTGIGATYHGDPSTSESALDLSVPKVRIKKEIPDHYEDPMNEDSYDASPNVEEGMHCGTAIEEGFPAPNEEAGMHCSRMMEQEFPGSEQTSDGIFPCRLCEEVFDNAQTENRHTADVHKNKKPHHCVLGSDYFASSDQLEIHNATHDETTSYQCYLCPKNFTQKSRLKKHIALHNQTHMCDLCFQIFPEKESLVNHQSTHDNKEEKYECEECPMTFGFPSELAHHTNSHSKSSFKCDICQNVFSSMFRLNVHMISHEETHRCEICSKDFPTRRQKKVHMTSVHKSCNYHCDQCPKAFRTPYKLERHKQVHEGRAKHHCHICNKWYANPVIFEKHMASHDVVFECDICNEEFSSAYKLKVHRPIHNDCIYKCKECELSFPTSYKLKLHRASHRELISCDLCNKTFPANHRLKRHMNEVHSGIKFQCTYCEKSYTTQYKLKKHLEAHTQVNGEVANVSNDLTNSDELDMDSFDQSFDSYSPPSQDQDAL